MEKEHRIGFYAWQSLGFNALDLIETGGVLEEVDGKMQIRVKMEGCPDMIYKTKEDDDLRRIDGGIAKNQA